VALKPDRKALNGYARWLISNEPLRIAQPLFPASMIRGRRGAHIVSSD